MADNDLSVVAADNTIKSLRSKDDGFGRQIQIALVGEHQRVFLAPQSITLTGVAQSLTVPSGATHALILAEGASGTDYARYWQDGTTPTAAVGKKLFDGQEIPCAAPATFKAILGSGAITLRVEYYKYV